MPGNLKSAEYLADTIAHKVSQLISERNRLRQELAARTDGALEQDKAYVEMFRSGVLDGACADERIMRLERILRVR